MAAIALAWLAAKGRGKEVNSATLIGRWSILPTCATGRRSSTKAISTRSRSISSAQGYIDSVELQRLFAAMRANDLIWSSVVNHYLLDSDAPPSDLLYWFEDGARIPAAFLKSYNRDLLLDNKLKDPAGFRSAAQRSTWPRSRRRCWSSR